MYRRSPTANAYWNDKRVSMKNIKRPVFILGSDVSSPHTMGSIRAWLEIPHDNKWIKWGSKQEWFELYSVPHSNKELAVFFDRYLKGEENSWEETPKVRWSQLQFGDLPAIEDIVLEDYPVPNAEYKDFSWKTESFCRIRQQRSLFNSTTRKSLAASQSLTSPFPKRRALLGLPKAILYISCKEKGDLCVYVIIRKKDRNGKTSMHLNFPVEATPISCIDEIPEKQRASLNLHQGSVGILRASYHAIDETKSIHPQFPFHPHEKEEKIPPGEIVRLEIGICNVSIDFDAGETVRIQIGGQFLSIAEYKSYSAPRPEHERNKGLHLIHSGPGHPSSAILPVVPFTSS